MQTEFPTATGFSGAYLVGNRRHLTQATAQTVGSFVLRRGYTINGAQLIPDAGDKGIAIADKVVDGKGESYIRVVHESNMAVYKPRADLIVEGFYADKDSCWAQVTDDSGTPHTWLFRSKDIPKQEETGAEDIDAGDNMFGWEQRIFKPRLRDALDADNKPPDNKPPNNAPVFNNRFFNAYRRRFANNGFPAASFASDAGITIIRHRPSDTDEQVQFSLHGESIRAEILSYAGRGPDKRSHWCCESIDAIKLDTVVVTPSKHRVYVLWRGVWDFGRLPSDRYRLLKVTAHSGDKGDQHG